MKTLAEIIDHIQTNKFVPNDELRAAVIYLHNSLVELTKASQEVMQRTVEVVNMSDKIVHSIEKQKDADRELVYDTILYCIENQFGKMWEDFEHPNWEIASFHDWKNCVDDEIVGIWDNLMSETKLAFVLMGKRIADQDPYEDC